MATTANAPSTAQVLSGKPKASGGVFRGPLNVTTPADASAALDSKMVGLGYVSSDGLTETIDRSTEKITAWGGDTVKVVQTEHSVVYKLTLTETANAEVLKAAYGDSNVTTTPASASKGTLHKILVNSKTLEPSSWDFEMADGGADIRIFVPNGQVTSVGDITYSDEEVVGYELEIEALPDKDGNKAYKYVQLADKTGSTGA